MSPALGPRHDPFSRGRAPVVVAGAGLAGISAARHLGPYPTVLFDREDEVGGTARSVSVDGFTFDHTGHLLHLHNDYTKRLVRRLLKDNVMECSRSAWIHSHGVDTPYPFQVNLKGLPWSAVEDCFAGLWAARRRYGKDPLNAGHALNFAEWCDRLFGAGITAQFMRPYNEKLWTVPVDEMTPEWCGGFVPQPRLEDVLAGALKGARQGFGYNTTFLYPKRGGVQVLAKALAEGLPDVRLKTSLEKVFWKERRVRLSGGADVSYAHLVSCLPLPELVRRLEPFPEELRAPLEKLRWTSVTCLNLGVKRKNISDKSWIYFPEKEFVFYRVGFPMNFTPYAVPAGCSSMYVEVSHAPGEGPQTPAQKAALLKKVRAGLEKAGIMRKSDEFAVAHFLPIRYAYVIYDRDRTPAAGALLEWLREKAHCSSIGRYGAWKYSFMEEAILDGKAVAESLTRHL